MSSRIRLIDITRLKKSSWLVQAESEKALKQARQSLRAYEEMMEDVSMDRKALHKFLNSDEWPAHYRHKARQDLLQFKDELKSAMAQDIAAKRKEIKLASRLLVSRDKKASQAKRVRKGRTGFI
ncbi:hypothetical protein CI610_00630 [invertebrate metagenome]|uniref:Uncharacterized protein n=1 Tax=invertebrate metagenome TaxID=1711999 RepID=A0A2H9TB96_9ZZZZ